MNRRLRVLTSRIDDSINFTVPFGGGVLESRYVRREADYLTCYLSSHSGCVKACKFCHLTQTFQTSFDHAENRAYLDQARLVLDHYEATLAAGGAKASFVYFSFMSRGEPLANRHVLTNADRLLTELGELAAGRGLASRFCISSIFPRETRNKELHEIFRHVRPTIYYSLYSLSPNVRKTWIPMAEPPEAVLQKLARWQAHTGALVKIHGAVIKGVNDDRASWEEICEHIKKTGLHCEFNLVAYNPHSPSLGAAGDMALVSEVIRRHEFKAHVKERVGFDVKASCGMFIDAKP